MMALIQTQSLSSNLDFEPYGSPRRIERNQSDSHPSGDMHCGPPARRGFILDTPVTTSQEKTNNWVTYLDSALPSRMVIFGYPGENQEDDSDMEEID